MSDSFSDIESRSVTGIDNLTFTDGLLGGQPWLEEPGNGPTFFPEPPLARDESEVIEHFEPERRPQLNFKLPAIGQDNPVSALPPWEPPRPHFHDPEAFEARWDATDDGLFEFDAEMKAEVFNRIGIAH